jgi:hypothetical protein
VVRQHHTRLKRGARHNKATMTQLERELTLNNVHALLKEYTCDVEKIGGSIEGMKGQRLLEALKRDKVKVGPYPDVTLFEAANRIMTDLIILYGVKWLLESKTFPFDSYTVEFGNEDENGFDIRAEKEDQRLVGEAFNVAPSFFQIKKSSMLKKLRESDVDADYKVIMFNHDAVNQNYRPKPKSNEFFVFVQVGTADSFMAPNTALNPDAQRRHAG